MSEVSYMILALPSYRRLEVLLRLRCPIRIFQCFFRTGHGVLCEQCHPPIILHEIVSMVYTS